MIQFLVSITASNSFSQKGIDYLALLSVTDPVCSGSSKWKIKKLDSLPALADPNCNVFPTEGTSGVDLFNVTCSETGTDLWYTMVLVPSDYQNELPG